MCLFCHECVDVGNKASPTHMQDNVGMGRGRVLSSICGERPLRCRGQASSQSTKSFTTCTTLLSLKSEGKSRVNKFDLIIGKPRVNLQGVSQLLQLSCRLNPKATVACFLRWQMCPLSCPRQSNLGALLLLSQAYELASGGNLWCLCVFSYASGPGEPPVTPNPSGRAPPLKAVLRGKPQYPRPWVGTWSGCWRPFRRP